MAHPGPGVPPQQHPRQTTRQSSTPPPGNGPHTPTTTTASGNYGYASGIVMKSMARKAGEAALNVAKGVTLWALQTWMPGFDIAHFIYTKGVWAYNAGRWAKRHLRRSYNAMGDRAAMATVSETHSRHFKEAIEGMRGGNYDRALAAVDKIEQAAKLASNTVERENLKGLHSRAITRLDNMLTRAQRHKDESSYAVTEEIAARAAPDSGLKQTRMETRIKSMRMQLRAYQAALEGSSAGRSDTQRQISSLVLQIEQLNNAATGAYKHRTEALLRHAKALADPYTAVALYGGERHRRYRWLCNGDSLGHG